MAEKILISYSHSDQLIADRIQQHLSERGLDPWIDRKEIQPGQSFIQGMNTIVGDAAYVLVLFSEASQNSFWMNREWMSALAGRVPVMPVLLPGGELPPLLKDVIAFDLRTDEA